MPNAITRFGIKEVADVTFYNIVEVDGVVTQGPAVLKFDTLKVSNIESTAESAEARGGKGNAALISWDYGREITVTLEDALLSMETLALLFENDTTPGDTTDGLGKEVVINANKFPGTYYVEGTTFARNEVDGKDHLFKFIIPKAKIQSETTLTMEAEGDPTVIGMTLKVLRPKDGNMMRLVRETAAYVPQGSSDKVSVSLVSATGAVTNYVLTTGEDWPTGINPENYTSMPAKVVGGTYYAKETT